MKDQSEMHRKQALAAGRPFEGPDANRVLANARQIAQAETIQQVWTDFVAIIGAFGFDRVIYGYTRFRVGDSIGDPGDVLFLSTHALDKVRAFHDSGLYLRSADYRWVRENVGSCSWGWVQGEYEAGRLSATEAAAFENLRPRHGPGRAGMTISFPEGPPRSKGAMGLAAPSGVTQAQVDAHWDRVGNAVMVLAHTAHSRFSQLPFQAPRAALTDRQREMLEWTADGKTLQDIVVLTGLSLSAVEKSLRRAREALMVETTAQAVAKAAFLNQIFVSAHGPGGN